MSWNVHENCRVLDVLTFALELLGAQLGPLQEPVARLFRLDSRLARNSFDKVLVAARLDEPQGGAWWYRCWHRGREGVCAVSKAVTETHNRYDIETVRIHVSPGEGAVMESARTSG